MNAYFQRESLAAAFRMIPARIRSLEEINMPTRLYEFAEQPRGLVLVTGPTGSGKSTTLAALLAHVNKTRHEHILTIEDPIEFLHWHGSCIVNQRELGPDALSFADALRAALREDPDVILVGEMRDLETISTALTAAETGHLVFATLHTQSAPQTIDRVIDVFPAAQQGQIRVQLAATLQGIVTQNLVPTADGRGRVAALEILDARRRGAEPHPAGEDRADLLGHADQHRARDDDDGAVARRSRSAAGHLHRHRLLRARRGPTSSRGSSSAPASAKSRTSACSRPSPRWAAFPTSAFDWQVRSSHGLKKELKFSDLVPKRQQASGKSAPKVAAKKKKAKQDYVGVKVGASQIAAAEVHNNGGSKIVKLAREPLEPGIVVGGEVRDIAALGRALDEFFKKHDLPRKGVRLGVGTNRVGVRVLDVDGIDDDKQLANAVTFRAHEALSIPMDQAVMDYHVVGTQELDGGGRLASRDPGGRVSRADRSFCRSVRRCGHPARRDRRRGVRAAARRRAHGHAVRRRAHCGRRALASVTTAPRSRSPTGTLCDFTRVLEWGGGRLDAAIARELGVTTDEASEVKLGALADRRRSRDSARARNAVKHELTTLARELVASLQFYQAQPDSLALAEILVTGGTTRMPGFVEELERLVRARVRTADPLSAVQADANISARNDLASLAIAIGLGVDR